VVSVSDLEPTPAWLVRHYVEVMKFYLGVNESRVVFDALVPDRYKTPIKMAPAHRADTEPPKSLTEALERAIGESIRVYDAAQKPMKKR
jgi:hypothetical protein